MDAYEATKTVMSRIQSLDPENTSKIMGYILLQDQGEEEMIRLAFGPDALLMSYINKAKAFLRLPSCVPSSDPSAALLNPIKPNSPYPQTSPRIVIPNNGHHFSNLSSPAAPLSRNSPRPFSYAAALNGSHGVSSSISNNGLGSAGAHFYGGSEFGDELTCGGGGALNQPDQDQLPFQDDSLGNPVIGQNGRSDSLCFPYREDVIASSIPSPEGHPFHKRSCSLNDAAFLANLEEGCGWRPCMYFARGFCKNGSSCRFLHTDCGDGEALEVESPNNSGSAFDELLRFRALQQQRFALMSYGGRHPLAYNKCMTFLNDKPRNEFSAVGLCAGGSSSSRQIYLTFPSDSTFKEDDVSDYFNTFGPVQDVRIPYQQKRMFGFVTFVYAETVKLILAKGNPHFVCDSRVLVKPYKEKGRVLDKKQQAEQVDGGEYPASLSPSGIDSRERFEIPAGSRMLFSAQELMLRRKLEQEAELQHAFELQGRRMMDLRLMDLKNQGLKQPFSLRLPAGYPLLPLRQSHPPTDQSFISSSDTLTPDVSVATEKTLGLEGTVTPTSSTENMNCELKQGHGNDTSSDLLERSLEDSLPDSLFASPSKLVADHQPIFSSAEVEYNIHATNTSASNTRLLTVESPLATASLKSGYAQMPWC